MRAESLCSSSVPHFCVFLLPVHPAQNVSAEAEAVLPPTKAVLPPTSADQAAIPASTQVPTEVPAPSTMLEVQAEVNPGHVTRGQVPGGEQRVCSPVPSGSPLAVSPTHPRLLDAATPWEEAAPGRQLPGSLPAIN